MERPYTPECIIPRDGDFHDIEVFDYGDHVEIFDCAEDVHVSKNQLPRLIESLCGILKKKIILNINRVSRGDDEAARKCCRQQERADAPIDERSRFEKAWKDYGYGAGWLSKDEPASTRRGEFVYLHGHSEMAWNMWKAQAVLRNSESSNVSQLPVIV